MTLGIDNIVHVDAQITPARVQSREFGRTLLLTSDPTLPSIGAGRVRTFSIMEQVSDVFSPDSEPYQAARVYFSQTPYPRPLLVGRWAEFGEGSRLTGGRPLPLVEITGSPTVVKGAGVVASLDSFHGRATVLTGTGTVVDLVNFHGRATVLTGTGTVADLVNFHGRATVLTGTGTVADLVNFHGRATVVTGTGTVASLTTLQGITSGSVTFLSQTVTGLDFSLDTDLDGVASTLQTALRATSSTDLDNAEVAYDSAASAFVVTLPLDSSGVVPTASAAFTGDDADELGLDTATIVNGVDAIVSGTVTFLSQTVTSLDFSSVTDYDGVASVLQTALRATSSTDLDNAEVTYDSAASVFVVTLPLDSSGVVPTASAAFTGDDADELGLDTATIVNGVDAIVSGTVTFLSQTLTGLDFSAVTDYDGVASVLQTALRATSSTDLDNAEVAYNSAASVFVVTIPLDSSGAATSVSAAFTSDDADELGLDTATIVDGVSAIQSGSVTLLDETFSSLDFSAVTDYDGVASVLQDALRAAAVTALASVEVAYQGGVFVMTIPLDSQGAATSVSGAFTGDTGAELGLDTATIVNGVDAIKSGSFSFLSQALTGLDFSAVTDYEGVATLLQTALRGTASAALGSVEVVHDGSQFVLTLPLDSDGGATEVTDPFTGDNADELGLDSAEITPGVDGIGNASVVWQGAAISGLDFTVVTSYTNVAATLQTGLRAAGTPELATATVAYDVRLGVFMVTLGFDIFDGSPYQVNGHFVDTAQSAAAALGLVQPSGGAIAPGYADESIEEAVAAVQALDSSWYFLTVDRDVAGEQELLDLAAWVQAQPHMLALDVSGPDTLAPEETTSLAARLSALELDRTFLVWSAAPDYKALSMAARLSSVRFDGQNTLITAKFKSLPGTIPDALDRVGQLELDRKRVNYYTRFGPAAIFAEGWTLKPGTWIDVLYWLDWIVNRIQRDVFDLLHRANRVPLTSVGVALIEDTIERACEAGRRNGGIAPGRVSESLAHDIRQATGNPNFDGFLTRGYLVVVGAIDDRPQQQRDQRIAPPGWVWLKGSGAIHQIEIALNLEN